MREVMRKVEIEQMRRVGEVQGWEVRTPARPLHPPNRTSSGPPRRVVAVVECCCWSNHALHQAQAAGEEVGA
jgi:hypothetical protein